MIWILVYILFLVYITLISAFIYLLYNPFLFIDAMARYRITRRRDSGLWWVEKREWIRWGSLCCFGTLNEAEAHIRKISKMDYDKFDTRYFNGKGNRMPKGME